MTILGNLAPAKPALANRNFRLYVIGTVASDLGLWIYRIGLSWLAWELTHSTTWLGIVHLPFEQYGINILLLGKYFCGTCTGWPTTDNGYLVLHIE